MRPDVVALLKSSKNAFICGLMGIDPVATFRWAVLRAYFRALVAFREAGRRHTHKKTGEENLVYKCMYCTVALRAQYTVTEGSACKEKERK